MPVALSVFARQHTKRAKKML